MRKLWVIPLLALAVTVAAAGSPPGQFGVSTDEIRIRATVMDYVEGLYDRDAGRMARALHPDAQRHIQVANEHVTGSMQTREDLVALADDTERCVVGLPRRGPKRVLVYEMRDNVAAARLTAAWGVDLLHLAKEDGRWRIVGIVGTARRSLVPQGDAA